MTTPTIEKLKEELMNCKNGFTKDELIVVISAREAQHKETAEEIFKEFKDYCLANSDNHFLCSIKDFEVIIEAIEKKVR